MSLRILMESQVFNIIAQGNQFLVVNQRLFLLADTIYLKSKISGNLRFIKIP